MNHGDAFNNMPEEYREYVEGRPKGGRAEYFASEERDIMASIEKEHKPEQSEVDKRCGTCGHWRDEVCSSPVVRPALWPGTMSRSTTPEDFHCGTHWVAIGAPEQSEADKAIADGKPRWMCHSVLGWQYVVFVRREDHRHPKPLLVYREVIEKASEIHEKPLLLVHTAVEILPYGETPPPAKPEKPQFIESQAEAIEDRRSLLRICRKIIDQSCIRGLRVTEYPATIPIMSTFLRDLCDTIIEIDDKATAVGEGPMHPDMIRAELQKAMDEAYRSVYGK